VRTSSARLTAFVALVASLSLGLVPATPRASAATTSPMTVGNSEVIGGGAPVEHEQVPPDPLEDVTLATAVEGDLPAALDTPSGLVSAPDPRAPVQPNESAYAPGSELDTAPDSTFRPDRDTRRPDTLSYDDPFTPSTAPFKRLVAYDAVDANENLYVQDETLRPVPLHSQVAADGSEEQFYANFVVQLIPGRRVRIPSVGPGARVLRAHAVRGTTPVGVRLTRDGADNWFIEGDASTRARVVMELSIPRATFGGFGDPKWEELLSPSPLPPAVAREAGEVAQHIGVSKQMSPRADVEKMVGYFRSFVDSDAPPGGGRDVYLDLALSRKGVCRHRAFAFVVTALGLGIPTRMVLNEAHAWVEVNDGQLWRRIDLGGAGDMQNDKSASNVPYEPPADPFAWPAGEKSGTEMADRAREANGQKTARSGKARSGSNPGDALTSQALSRPGGEADEEAARQAGGTGPNASGRNGASPTANGFLDADSPLDERPKAAVTLQLEGGASGADLHREQALHVSGTMIADGEPCPHALVSVMLRDARTSRELVLGSLATGDDGRYDGSLVVPGGIPLGDYDVVARTVGDARCGAGVSP
jgi:transglutaminase-like putative cysteine protease